MIDFHAHILPGADHGCADAETAKAQLTFARNAGVEEVIATPHFYPQKHRVNTFLESREASARLLQEIAKEGTFPPVRLGAEVLLCEGLDGMEGLSSLCVDGTNILLLEMPFVEVTDGMLATAGRIEKELGLRVLWAHIDRYEQKTAQKALSLIPRAQLNAGAFSSFFCRRTCLAYLKEGVVYALGSDIHGKDAGAYRAFLHAQKALGKDLSVLEERGRVLLGKPFPKKAPSAE